MAVGTSQAREQAILDRVGVNPPIQEELLGVTNTMMVSGIRTHKQALRIDSKHKNWYGLTSEVGPYFFLFSRI